MSRCGTTRAMFSASSVNPSATVSLSPASICRAFPEVGFNSMSWKCLEEPGRCSTHNLTFLCTTSMAWRYRAQFDPPPVMNIGKPSRQAELRGSPRALVRVPSMTPVMQRSICPANSSSTATTSCRGLPFRPPNSSADSTGAASFHDKSRSSLE